MTKSKTIFNGKIRQKAEKSGALRRQGLLPANIFGLKQDSMGITLDKKIFTKHFQTEGDAGLIYVEVDGSQVPVLIDEVQQNPVDEQLVHVTLQRVNLKEKIVSAVPLEMINENEIKEGIVLLTRQEVEVEAFPADLPESIVIDASGLLAVGDELRWDAVTFDREKVKIMLPEEEMDQPLVLVQAVQEEKVEEVVTEAVGVEGEGEVTPAEGGEEAAPPQDKQE